MRNIRVQALLETAIVAAIMAAIFFLLLTI
jgi:hypothetical protein